MPRIRFERMTFSYQDLETSTSETRYHYANEALITNHFTVFLDFVALMLSNVNETNAGNSCNTHPQEMLTKPVSLMFPVFLRAPSILYSKLSYQIITERAWEVWNTSPRKQITYTTNLRIQTRYRYLNINC